MIEEKG